MKRVKRRPGRSPLKKFERHEPNTNNNKQAYIPSEVKEVYPPRKEMREDDELITEFGQQNPFTKNQSNRCTFYRPSNEDFGQLTDIAMPLNDYYQNLLQEICTDPAPGTTKPELKNACQGSEVQTRSAFVEPASGFKIDDNVEADRMDETRWQTIDTISDADLFLSRMASPTKISEETPKSADFKCSPSVRISSTPRVKRIAEKFSKFKKNNVEVRKLEERVVCLEYDIFDLKAADPAEPVQHMRAFFSIKMNDNEGANEAENIPFIPSSVKRNFNIDEGDLQQLNKKEIEIIDEEIPQNRSLLEDLKRVLRRKKALENRKKQTTLDLMCLYEMAKRESPPMNSDYSNTDLLSKSELQEIKDLILKKCESNVYGINRRTVKCTDGDTADDAKCVLSNNLIHELLREAEKV